MDSRVEEIYLRAIELPVTERGRFVRNTAEDVAVRQQVDRLLQHTDQAKAYFEHIGKQVDGLTEDICQERQLSEPLPAQIGPYRPTRVLGRGGMGVVYLAERGDGAFEQQVAVKVIATQLAAADAQRRFLQERQILAQLDHPNICRLLDGGLTDDALPYLVMEYVQGQALDAYCDEHCLGIAARLELFGQVCSAVQHAHRNLVLHRDLKPNNIWVDHRGQVRLLDFGVAKALDEHPETEQTTRLPLTPRYASPEQLLGRPAGISSDVYALGVLLYRLLIGVHPHELGEKSLAEDLQVLAASNSPLMSVRLAQLGAARQRQLAIARSTTASALEDQIRGDLDNIVAKAVRLESELRYSDVGELAADVQNHLNHRPVTARPHSTTYLISRFVRRHRIGVAATLLICGLGVGLVATTVYSALRSAEQNRIIASERDRAETISNFLIGLFEQTDPDRLDDRAMTVTDLLDAGAKQLETELLEQPESRAELLRVVAQAQAAVGEFDKQRRLLESAIAVRQDLGTDRPELARLHELLATNADARGDAKAALEYAQTALEIRQQAGDDLGAAHAHRRIGRAQHRAGKLEAAGEHYLQALAIYQRERGREHRDTAQMLSHLGWLAMHQNDLEESVQLHNQAKSIRVALFGQQHTTLIESHLGLGQVYMRQQAYEDAAASFQQALHITTDRLGPTHPNNGFIFNSLGKLEREQSRLDRAAVYFTRSANIWAMVDSAHPDRGYSLGDLGMTLLARGKLDEATENLQHAVDILTEKRPDHWRLSELRAHLGSALSRAGQHDQGQQLLLAAAASLEQHEDKDDTSMPRVNALLDEHFARTQRARP